MKTSYHPSQSFNAKAQWRNDKPATPDATPHSSAPWRLGVLALNSVRAALLVAVIALLPTAAHAQAIEAWVQRYHGPGNDHDFASSLAVDTNGNVYVTGQSSILNGPPDYATIKYSSAGVSLWTNRYDAGAIGGDGAVALALDSNGKVLVTGHSDGGGSGDDYVTIKYSSAGVPLWTNR